MSQLTRRGFLKNSASLGALAMAGCAAAGRPKQEMSAVPPPRRGANERIRVAVAGINGRGESHIDGFASMKDVEVVYLVDPDSRLFNSRIKLAQDRSRGESQKKKSKEKSQEPSQETSQEKSPPRSNPKCVQDIRRILDDKSIDVVSIATPNHWHSLLTIWACQAGKDVYVEKPMSHNIHEGRIAVDTARKYQCIVQHGTQSRSSKDWRKIVAVIHSGKLGKLLVSRGLCYKSGGGGDSTRGSIGFRPYKEPPPELDFNIWLGPAPEQPYHENLVHYRWHWFWDFGNGDLGNQGVHQMDIARWAIPGGTLPKSVLTFGGRLGYYDQGEVASTEVAVMDFGGTKLIFETRGLPSKDYRGVGVGNIFELEAGTIVDHKFFPKDSKQEAPLPEVEFKCGPGDGNFANFIAAVRSRKTSDLNAEILEGHYSAACCHLANMSIRVGHKVPFSPRPQILDSDPDIQEVLTRTEDHLKANHVELEKSGYTLGRKLMVDAKTETIINDGQASQLLTRCYRKPFVVPDTV